LAIPRRSCSRRSNRKSEAVKQQYWLYVSMQKQRNQVGSIRLYPVQLPEQRIDGVTFQPSTKILRIEE